MKVHRVGFFRGAMIAAAVFLHATAGSAQGGGAGMGTGLNPIWDSVGKVLLSPPTNAAGYVRYNFPRKDIPLKLNGVDVAPGLALGTWAGFAGSADSAVVMGDLVLLGGEVPGVLAALDSAGLEVTAIHNHLAGEIPALTYVHIHGKGTAVSLAAAVDRVLRVTATPRPVTAGPPAPVAIDTAEVVKALGLHGRANGAVLQMGPVLMPGPVTVQGRTLVPALAYGSPINLQLVTPDRMVAAGDFAVLEARVTPLLHALTSHGITPTAMHSHLIGETPRVYYIHFWGDGTPKAILDGLKAALEAVGR